jgi:hypothetical protein
MSRPGYRAVGLSDYAGLEKLMAEDISALRLPAAPVTTGTTAAAPSPAPAVEGLRGGETPGAPN